MNKGKSTKSTPKDKTFRFKLSSFNYFVYLCTRF